MENKPRYIIIHCSDTSYRQMSDQLKMVDDWHGQNDYPKSSLGYYVGYHRLITGDKNIKCREDKEVGAHCNSKQDGVSLNFQSLGVCVGFDGDIEFPTPMQYELLQKQVWEWQDKYGIPNDCIRFHRYWATNKTCPGSLLTTQWLKDLLRRPEYVSVKEPERMCIAQDREISYLKELIRSLLVYFARPKT